MITLASDFGSPYPAAVRGVLLSRTDARLVDVAHDFPRHDVRAAAFWLRETLPYFPAATHLVVVDPGVGTDRDALVVRAGEHVLVAPDNGVVRPVARRFGDDPDTYVVDESGLEPVAPADAPAADPVRTRSATFHGRDVFAPVAAAVHDAADLEALPFLERADASVDLELPTATLEGDRATGEVLVVDDFGNAITNVPGEFLAPCEEVRANGDAVPVVETFAAVPAGDRLATVGSHGYVELDVNRGRGDEAFGLAAGDRVRLERD